MSLIKDSGETWSRDQSFVDMSALSLLVLLLLALYPVRRNVTYHALFQHRNHTRVFEHLADVSALQQLNPTIVNVTLWERGSAGDFYVEYTECLSQVPVVRNHGRARYKIRRGDDGSHRLDSRHSTCFYTSFLCLPTESSVRVDKASDSEVGYVEDIAYSCPWALIPFCFHEITFQRNLIVARLREVLSDAANTGN